jgi:glycosyltransferase involved in cell wall biosynthesis
MHIRKRLTIVIPTYNEEKYISNTIESIAKQNHIYGTRVIIADNNSTDNTRNIISQLKKQYSNIINIELIDGGNVSRGRNNGAKITKTEYILFMDGDVILTNPNHIYRTLKEMKYQNLDLLTSKVESYGNDIRTKFIFKVFNIVNKIISKVTPFAVGTYFMTKTNLFYMYGMFDEEVKHSEDYLLSKKYPVDKFKISNHYVGQDDRRFKKMGYMFMVVMLIKGFINKDNIDYFKKDIGYW